MSLERIDFTGWSLNLAKDRNTGEWFLALANMDNNDVRLLATFPDQGAADVFTDFMEQQGWLSLKLPTQGDIDSFMDDQP